MLSPHPGELFRVVLIETRRAENRDHVVSRADSTVTVCAHVETTVRAGAKGLVTVDTGTSNFAGPALGQAS
eukprot:SAG11_NODE_24916_length_366_cov_0.745318_1_plen_71_part_00